MFVGRRLFGETGKSIFEYSIIVLKQKEGQRIANEWKDSRAVLSGSVTRFECVVCYVSHLYSLLSSREGFG